MLTFDNYRGLFKFALLEKYGEVAGFVTTRHRPDGSGSNFNIGFSGGSQDDILANRQILADAIGVSGSKFVFQNQIHKDNIHVCDMTTAGAGFASKESAVQDTDILVTNQRGLCLVTRSADCIPVLLYSPDSHSIAAIHSGREGTYLGVAAKAADKLVSLYGANPANIIACIGPGIGGECYEVDMDCAQKFMTDQRFKPDTMTVKGEKVFLDLKKMIFYDLLTFGLVANNIEISDICTKCSNDLFFSSRCGDKQRFCAGIYLR